MMTQKNIDALRARGMVHLRVRDIEGNLIEEHRGSNLVVNTGRTALTALLATADADKRVTRAEWGEGTAAPLPSDTSLTNAYQNGIVSSSNPSPIQVQFELALGVSEGNGLELTELGLVCDDGTLFARYVWGSTISKSAGFSVEASWIIQF